LLALCAVIWGWTFIAIKILTAHFDSYEIVGLRFGIGLPILFALIRWQKIPCGFTRADVRPLLIGGGILLYHFLIQPLALRHTSATNTSWIIAFSPLSIAILSSIFLRERVSARTRWGIVIATLGIVLLLSNGRWSDIGSLANVGDWLILSTAFTWAIYTIVTRDVARRRASLCVTTAVFTPLLVVGVGYLVCFTPASKLAHLPFDAWVSILFLGILGTLAQWFWQFGVARIGAAKAGVFLYLEPVATTALAVPALGESFGVYNALGGLLVLAGVYWAEQ
jgi:drug/metabolite transporter (DMT)-like permease